MKNSRLWHDLQSFDFDGDAPFSFSKRLARDNNWSLEFAARVIDEYRRFLYLACEAGHPVTPSDEVDQAWHLHLTYSRSYWDDLCARVLQKPLHHGPTRGGKSEGEKFENWYEKTLESYRQNFGDAPRDIWPPSAIRFGKASHFRRVNTDDVWVLPKPKWKLRAPRIQIGWKLAPLLLALFLAGCAEAQNVGPNVFDWHGGPFLMFFWSLSALGIGFSVWMRSQSLRPLDAVFPVDPLDAYEVARLRDGKNLATDVALASLFTRGVVEIDEKGMLHATGDDAGLRPFERAVSKRVGSANTVLEVRRSLERELAMLDDKLRALGLLVSRETEKTAENWPIGITLGLLLIGAIKIVVGLSRQRPVGFLFLSCAVLVGILIYFMTHPARRSKRGDAFLARLSAQRFSSQATRAQDFDAMAMHFAFIGAAAYPSQMQRAMRPPSSGADGGSGCSSSSGGDSGGGDGGGGDGGGGGCGGGGCGGCGGGD